MAKLRGVYNERGEDCPGLSMTIEAIPDQVDNLIEYARDDSNPAVVPVEYYAATWRSFSGNGVNIRQLPFRAAKIDASIPRIARGPNRYVSQIISDVLDDIQRRDLALEYKKLRHKFSQEAGVQAINSHLKKQGATASTKELSIQMDMSSRATWDSGITAHLNDLPFDCAGKGEQCKMQLRLAVASATTSHVVLIEEPENHLSHSNLRGLLEDIRTDCKDQQVIVTTHSAFVLNKLGIDNLKLISTSNRSTSLNSLTPSTRDYFMKLPGYDTLRLLLAKRSILVEGPSDELLVQHAYKQKFNRLPIEDGVDIIAVGALAFLRFLEIAEKLHLKVTVITDNDGNVEALKRKYSHYLNNSHPNIHIQYDEDESHATLEPQLLKSNSRELLNRIFGKSYETDDKLLAYMARKKTDCALKLLESKVSWTVPPYILNAIER